MVFGHHGALGLLAKEAVEMANKAEVGLVSFHKVAKIALEASRKNQGFVDLNIAQIVSALR